MAVLWVRVGETPLALLVKTILAAAEVQVLGRCLLPASGYWERGG